MVASLRPCRLGARCRSLGRFGVDQAEETGHRRGARADTEIGADVLEVLPDGARREPQKARDLNIRLTAGDLGEYLAFACGQLGLFVPLFEQQRTVDLLHRQSPLRAPSSQRLLVS
jgi:hypothetical protein